MASRIVCWRAGRSRLPPVSRSRRCSRRSSRAAGGRTRTQAAASSMARGKPSRRRQMAATAAALSGSGQSVGALAVARSRKRATAGTCANSATDERRSLAGSGSGSSGNLAFTAHAQGRSARGQHRELRAGGKQGGDLRSRLEDLLAVVEQEQQLLRREEREQSVSRSGCPARSRTPRVLAMVGRTNCASRTGARSTKTTPSRNAPCSCAPTSRARRVLPVPPGRSR